MPVVLRKDGFVVSFYANDHAPPHVHVDRAGTYCRILLWGLVVTHNTMKRADQSKAVSLVAQNRGKLLLAWNQFEAKKKGNA